MQLESIRRVNKFNRNVAKAYLFATVVTGLGYVLTPILKNFYNCVLSDGIFKYDLPMKGAFPFDIRKLENYVAVYIWYSFNTYQTIFISVAVDSFFFGSEFCKIKFDV